MLALHNVLLIHHALYPVSHLISLHSSSPYSATLPAPPLGAITRSKAVETAPRVGQALELRIPPALCCYAAMLLGDAAMLLGYDAMLLGYAALRLC